MAYRIEADRGSLAADVKRIATEQIDLALEHLRGAYDDDLDASVHAARQCFKRSRALLALVRDGLDEEVYRLESRCFRAAGRTLGELRDACVTLETLSGLERVTAGRLPEGTFRSTRHALERAQKAWEERAVGDDHALTLASALLAGARDRVADWELVLKDFGPLRSGLERTYRAGRRRFARVRRAPTDSNFHAWRKPVKVLFHELQVVSSAWPAGILSVSRPFRDLSDLLNESHDLSVLRETSAGLPARVPRRERDRLVALVDERCAVLELAAIELGSFAFSERPKAFVERVEGYWDVWSANTDVLNELVATA